MITIISPAKNLDFKTKSTLTLHTLPIFQEKAKRLIRELRKLRKEEIRDLMEINPKLAELNFSRFHEWSTEELPAISKQAILAFNGEVYNGLKAKELNEDELSFAQDHVRILSGLYGILRPLDMIQPYRLEMGIKLQVGKYENLYAYWGDTILKQLNQLAAMGNEVLINMASNEYSKAARLKKFKGRVITIVFKQLKGENLKVIVVYTKKARGLMTRFIVDNKIQDPEQLKLFDAEDYFYNENLSTEYEWVFTR